MTTLRTLTYIELEPPCTRPDVYVPPSRPGYKWQWIQNMRAGDYIYRAGRNEIPKAVYRKRASLFWDTSFVLPGEPRATAEKSVEQLMERGIIGVYGWQRVRKRSRVRGFVVYLRRLIDGTKENTH